MSTGQRYDNFANEEAQKYLHVLAAKLFATVNEIYIDPERLDLDEDGEAMFMPSIELLALLCERYNIEPPKPSIVQQWRDTYLRLYDDTIHEVSTDEKYIKERKGVIEKTFLWLMSLSETFWS